MSSDDAITYVLVGVLFALVFNLAAVVAWVLMDGLRWGRWAWDWLGAARGAPAPPRPEGVPPVSLGGSLRYGLGIGLNGFTFGAAYVLFAQLILSLNPPGGMPALAVTLGPSLFLLAVLAGGYVEVVVAGNTMDEFEREWRSRTGALLFRLAFVWVLLFGSVVYLPYAIRAIPWVSWVSFVGWLVTTGAGFIVARRTTAHSSRWLLVAVRVVPIVFLLGLFAIGSELSMMLVRPVEEGRNFLWNIEHTSHAKTAQWWAALLLGSALAVLFVPATLFSLHALYMNRLTRCYLGASRSATGDIRNPRGPGLPPRPQRWPNRFTGFDPRDDLPLSALGTAAHAEEALRLLRDAVDVARRRPLVGPAEQAQLDQQLTEIETRLGRIAPGLEPERQRVLAAYAVRAALAPDQPVPKAVQDELTAAEADLRAKVRSAYPGPYPLLNTALNLVAGEDLAYQDRKGASFVFTPDYCGSRETGYARIPATAEAGHNLTLGRAMTISGAAVDPNMKDHQSAPLTAFLTILNARLGWWIQNPRAGDTDDGWTAKPPGAGGVHYLKELFGYTTEREPYVHLSDGGHFDASGAYELIRRRCRYVIAIDAAEDTYDASENLANLIRLVRADFGIEIEIDTAPLRKDENGISRAHCAIGVIRYDGVDRNGVNGTFVFIRSSITGDESADLKNYTHAKPPFPHHGTIDQFFDDAQFESYRRLGEHIGLSVFSEANRDVEPPPNGMSAAEWYDEFNRQLFANLRRQWVVRPASDAGYLESCRDYLRATGHLRDTPALHGLTRDLFPELRHVPPAVPEAVPVPLVPPSALAGILSPAVQVLPPTAGPEAELHAVDYLLQVMELAWMENDLENRYGNALNRGWMNVFRRWTVTESFHRFWPVLRSQYSRGFVRFCERALNLDRLPVRWSRLPPVPPAAPFRNPANPAHTVWTDSLDAAFKEFDDEFYREWMVVLSRAGVPKQAAETYLTGTVRRSNPPWVPWAGKPLAFALTTGRGGEPRGEFNDGWRRHHIPLGLVVAHVSAAVGGWELLVWIRGAHRTLGLARDSVPTILRDRIVPELRAAGVRTLHVRYPKLGTSHGDRFHRTAWEWFFNDLGFVRDWTVPEAIARNEVRLVRQL